MCEIAGIKKSIEEFLKSFGSQDIQVTKVLKTGDIWEIEAEVFEESSFIKALGLHTKVRDRNIYLLTLNDNMKVLSYEKIKKVS